MVTELESIKLSTTFALITDIVLLSIMLIGLSRIRRYGGMLALGRLLWNQVGHCSNASFQLLCSRLIDIYFYYVRVSSGS